MLYKNCISVYKDRPHGRSEVDETHYRNENTLQARAVDIQAHYTFYIAQLFMHNDIMV